MALNMVVLAKQVPDTKHISGKVMKDDGTVNRAALPMVYNPEDLIALGLAVELRGRYGGRVTVITMGTPMAATILRDSLYRGADDAILLTDRRLAASDTLATSYALARAVEKLSPVDLVLCGRQAIDGDTAQVGPQTAEKLGIPQVTYVTAVNWVENGRLEAHRDFGDGYEVVRCPLPALLTVYSEEGEPPPAQAKRLLRWRHSRTPSEVAVETRVELAAQKLPVEELNQAIERRRADLAERGLLLQEWSAEAIGAEQDRIGKAGSPTMVKEIESIVLKNTAYKNIEPTEAGLQDLIAELRRDRLIP